MYKLLCKILFLFLLVSIIKTTAANQPLWSYKTKGDVLSVSIDDGYVAAGSSDHRIYLFKNGELLWGYDTNDQVWSVAMDNGLILAGSGYCVYLFDKSGALLWKYKTDGWVKCVSIKGDCIVAGSTDGNVYFFNKSGKVWSYKTNGWVWSVSTDGYYVVAGTGHNDHKVYFFSKDGSFLWSFDTGDWNWVKSVSVNNCVVVGTRDFEIYLLNTNGKLQWKQKVGNVWSVAVNGDYIAIGADKVYLFNREGKLLWSYKTGSNWVLSVSVTRNGQVVAGSRDSYVYFFDRSGDVWKYKTSGWVRSVSTNSNYAVAGSDKVYFFNLAKLNVQKVNVQKTVKSVPGFGLAICILGILMAYLKYFKNN